MSKNSTLNRNQLEQFLARLKDKAAADGKTIDLFISGSAAMVLSETGGRTTVGDIDFFTPDTEAAQYLHRVESDFKAAQNDMTIHRWLDGPHPAMQQMAARPEEYFYRYYLPVRMSITGQNQGLRFYVLKPEPQLAAKLLRFNLTEQDYRDIYNMCLFLRVKTAEQLRQVWRRYCGLFGEGMGAAQDKNIHAIWTSTQRLGAPKPDQPVFEPRPGFNVGLRQ